MSPLLSSQPFMPLMLKLPLYNCTCERPAICCHSSWFDLRSPRSSSRFPLPGARTSHSTGPALRAHASLSLFAVTASSASRGRVAYCSGGSGKSSPETTWTFSIKSQPSAVAAMIIFLEKIVPASFPGFEQPFSINSVVKTTMGGHASSFLLRSVWHTMENMSSASKSVYMISTWFPVKFRFSKLDRGTFTPQDRMLSRLTLSPF